MRVATWNVNSLNARLEPLKEFLETRHPDVVALQETKIEDENFPEKFFKGMGYNCAFKGEKGYNGVAVLSRFEFDAVEKNFDWIENGQKRLIMVVVKGIKIMNAYFPHGKMIGSSYYKFKLDFIKKLGEYLKNYVSNALIITGDFNVAMERKDVYAPDIMQYSIGFSDAERKALKELYNTGFVDLFRMFNEEGKQYTWWDYRANSFKRNAGMRLDYIWATKKLAEKCRSCHIDKEMRSKPKPSDHAPIIADFEI